MVETAGGISIHVVDVTRGVPAHGMQVAIFNLTTASLQIASGTLSVKGTLEHSIVVGKTGDGNLIDSGIYEAVFYVGDFYRQLGYALPTRPFLDVVPFRFSIDDVAQHYHLPLKVSPWGFSLFRGG